MQTIVLAVSFIASLVAGQASVGSLPQCAIPCVTNGIAATGCQATDIHCFCTATAFLQSIAPCVYANCSVADQNLTQTVAQGICNAASPPVQLPSFSSLLNSTSSSAPASGSAAPSESAGSSASAAATTTGGAAGASSSAAAAASTSAATKSSASGQGDMRVMMAVGAMVGVMAIAFLAV